MLMLSLLVGLWFWVVAILLASEFGLWFWLFVILLASELGTPRLSYLCCVFGALSIKGVVAMIKGVS